MEEKKVHTKLKGVTKKKRPANIKAGTNSPKIISGNREKKNKQQKPKSENLSQNSNKLKKKEGTKTKGCHRGRRGKQEKKRKRWGKKRSDKVASDLLKGVEEKKEKQKIIQMKNLEDDVPVSETPQSREKQVKRKNMNSSTVEVLGSEVTSNTEPPAKKVKALILKGNVSKKGISGDALSKKKKGKGNSGGPANPSSVQKQEKTNKKSLPKNGSTDLPKKKMQKKRSGSSSQLESLSANTSEKKDDLADKKNPPLNCKSVEPKKNLKHTKAKKSANKNLTSAGTVSLNPFYKDPANKNNIMKYWKENGASYQRENGMEIIKTPFTCGYLPNFFENPEFLKGIQEELKEITPLKKNNDLYKFTQTPDLKSSDKPYISSLRDFLYGDFRKWLMEVTGIPLNEKVDMGSSSYEYTDVLLCHDDELEGRRIAYILYLVPSWEKSDGGTLDLFNTDNNLQPKSIVRSLVPQWNTFAFFEVSPISFHQVAEVLAEDKKRLSVNGWFHGPPIDRPLKHEEPPRPFLLPGHIEEDELYSWINPSYLNEETQKAIRKKFREDSEIELESFLAEEKYKELNEALLDKTLKWKQTGPANKNSYKVLMEKKQPDIVKQCLQFLQSEAMFLILSQLTGLSLHKLAPPDSEPDSDDEEEKEPNPRVRTCVRKWGHGSYTLIRDCDSEEQESALDTTLFLNVSKKWTEALGGYHSYISKDEDTELLSVLPRSNCFALVYRDAETLKFTKYINAGVLQLMKKNRHYFDFYCKYYE